MKRVLCTVAAASLGCSEPVQSLPGVTEEGLHVVVSADPGLRLCGGSLIQMDEFVERLSSEFSVAPPVGSARIDFTWLNANEFYDRVPCGEPFTACARGAGLIYTTYAPVNHELVHSVAFSIGRPPPFFAEGLAVAYQGLGDQVQPLGLLNSEQDVRKLIGLSGSELFATQGGYEIAGAFTAFIIMRFGIDSYLDIYSNIERDSGDADINNTLREILGISLEELIAEFEASPVSICGQGSYDAKIVECNAPEVKWDGMNFEEHRTLACDQEDVIGPGRHNTLVALRTLRVPQGGYYELSVVGDPAEGTFNGISLHHCEKCVFNGSLSAGADDPPTVIFLEAGLHSLRLHGANGERNSIGLRFNRLTEDTVE